MEVLFITAEEKKALKEAVDYVARLDTAIFQRYMEKRGLDVSILATERERQYKIITDTVRVLITTQPEETA